MGGLEGGRLLVSKGLSGGKAFWVMICWGGHGFFRACGVFRCRASIMRPSVMMGMGTLCGVVLLFRLPLLSCERTRLINGVVGSGAGTA